MYVAFINNTDCPNRLSLDGHPTTSKFLDLLKQILLVLSNKIFTEPDFCSRGFHLFTEQDFYYFDVNIPNVFLQWCWR